MSTMSTQVNWGSSIIVNDVYDRFINPDASEKQLVWVGRLCTVVLMVVSCALALILENALQVFNIILQIGAGTGLLFLLRWFWWRINAATELTAMVVSFCIAVYFQAAGSFGWMGGGYTDWERLIFIVIATTAAWLAVTYLTRPTDDETLIRFYQKVKPGGPGWEPVFRRAKERGLDLEAETESDLPYALTCAALGAVGIYSLLFATGFVLYSRFALGGLFTVVAVGALSGIVALWPKLTFTRRPASESEPAGDEVGADAG
jgi:hypothetical protein